MSKSYTGEWVTLLTNQSAWNREKYNSNCILCMCPKTATAYHHCHHHHHHPSNLAQSAKPNTQNSFRENIDSLLPSLSSVRQIHAQPNHKNKNRFICSSYFSWQKTIRKWKQHSNTTSIHPFAFIFARFSPIMYVRANRNSCFRILYVYFAFDCPLQAITIKISYTPKNSPFIFLHGFCISWNSPPEAICKKMDKHAIKPYCVFQWQMPIAQFFIDSWISHSD